MSANLTFAGAADAAYSPPGTHSAVGGSWQYDTDGVGLVSAGSNFARLFETTVCTGIASSEIQITLPSGAAYWSNGGPIMMDAALNGVKVEARGDAIVLIKEVAGSSGATIATFNTTNSSSTFALKLAINTSNGAVEVFKNGISVITATYTDFLSNLRAGMQTYRDNSISIPVDTLNTVTGGAAVTIDSLDNPLNVGGIHGITTTGLGTLTTATTFGGKNIASANSPGGDGTITFPGFVVGQTYPPMGQVNVIASDGTNTATAVRNLETMPGWQYVVVGSLDRGQWSLGKAFVTGENPLELHVVDDGTGILNDDGTLTNWSASGVFTCWARMAAGGGFIAGEMTSFTFSIVESGVVINKTKSKLSLGLSL